MTPVPDVRIVSGKAVIKERERASVSWPRSGMSELVFRKAYEVERTNWGDGLHDCVYCVHEREFKDLSCMAGETIEEFPNDHEIREHADGTRFLFVYDSIPTFDSGDREWDSMLHMALYADEEGINLIHCRHGYAIPRIRIYIGLQKSIPVVTEWLQKLGCDHLLPK